MDKQEQVKASHVAGYLGEFAGSTVIVNFIEPNVTNRRGVLVDANEVFVHFEGADGKKLLIPWAAISYISKEEPLSSAPSSPAANAA